MTEERSSIPEYPFSHAEGPEPIPPSPNRTGRIARLLIAGGLVLLLGWATIKGYRIYQATQGLLSLQAEAESLLAGGLDAVDPAATVDLVTGARADIASLDRELAFMKPLAPVLGNLPQVGPLAVALPYLLEMADAGSEAGAMAVQGLAPALSIVQRDGFGMSQVGELLPILQQATPQLDAAAQSLERYATARAALDSAVNTDDLPWRVRQLLVLADEWVPAGQAGLRLAPQLPLLLGMNGPQRYLIMAQNEDELRATGGFLTGAGVLTLENGRILDLSLRDANGVDNWREKPYDLPPQPYYDFMLSEMFLFRDANFWPDFPTSAQKAMDLYAYGQDESGFSGAVAIDQEFLRLLVDATGPISLEQGRNINSGNLIATLQKARDPEEGQAIGDWVGDRKAFLAGFAGAIRAKLEDDFSAIDPVSLARHMITALDGRHLQVYVREPAAAEALARAGWDGGLPTAPPGDMWMVADTNVGFNKVNLYVNRSFDYHVDLTAPGAATARLAAAYTHSGEASDEPCYQGVDEEFEQGAEYLALANKCYWNYVRVYVPGGSMLTESSRHVVPAESLFRNETWDSIAQPVAEIDGLTTFANLMLVPQGGTAEFYVSYTLPPGILQTLMDGTTVYELRVQKQAGTRPEPVHIEIALPPDAKILETSPAGAHHAGNHITFDAVLESDTIFRIRFR